MNKWIFIADAGVLLSRINGYTKSNDAWSDDPVHVAAIGTLSLTMIEEATTTSGVDVPHSKICLLHFQITNN